MLEIISLGIQIDFTNFGLLQYSILQENEGMDQNDLLSHMYEYGLKNRHTSYGIETVISKMHEMNFNKNPDKIWEDITYYTYYASPWACHIGIKIYDYISIKICQNI